MLRELFTRDPEDPGGGWEALRSAGDLAKLGCSDDEAIATLRAEHSGAALRWAAHLLGKRSSGDVYRLRRLSWLRRAAGEVADPGGGLWASVPDLPSMPLRDAFSELASRVPAVAGLEVQARRIAASAGFTRIPSQVGEDLLLHPSRESAMALRPMMRRSKGLVGPRSGSNDPVVASAEAEWVVKRYLLSVLEEEPEPGPR